MRFLACAAVAIALLLPGRAPAASPLDLARAARWTEVAALGAAALPPLLEAYAGADRETRTAILLALGCLNVKSSAAVEAIMNDVDGEDSRFQDIHRYALQVVDPTLRSIDLFDQVSAEGVPLDPELGNFMHATFSISYDSCVERAARASRYVKGLTAADPQARYGAIVSLRILTGASHAYHPWASDASRKKPLEAWRAWLHRLERSCRV